LDEGENPEEYLIVPSGGPSKIIPKKNGGTYFYISLQK